MPCGGHAPDVGLERVDVDEQRGGGEVVHVHRRNLRAAAARVRLATGARPGGAAGQGIDVERGAAPPARLVLVDVPALAARQSGQTFGSELTIIVFPMRQQRFELCIDFADGFFGKALGAFDDVAGIG